MLFPGRLMNAGERRKKKHLLEEKKPGMDEEENHSGPMDLLSGANWAIGNGHKKEERGVR